VGVNWVAENAHKIITSTRAATPFKVLMQNGLTTKIRYYFSITNKNGSLIVFKAV